MSEIKLVKCNPALVLETLRSYKLDTSGSLKQQVARLEAHFASLTGSVDIATCDVCLGDSDAALPSCPYCGDLGAVVEGVDSELPSAVEPQTPSATPLYDGPLEDLTAEALHSASGSTDEELDADYEASQQDDDLSEPTQSPSAEEVDLTSDDDDQAMDYEDESDDIPAADGLTDDQAVGDQQEDSVASKKVTKVTKTKTKPTAPAAKTLRAIDGGKAKPKAAAKAAPAAKAKPAAKKAATKAEPTKLARAAAAPAPRGDIDLIEVAEGKTLEDLQEQVDIIREAVVAGGEALHQMGSAAQEIIQSGLWKLVADKAGKPLYRSFKQYAVEELKISPTHIYRAIDTAKNFTVEQLKGLSGQQIRVVLQVPPEERKQLLDAAKKGASTSQLTDRANALRGGAKELPPPKKAITVAVAMGHQQMKLYKKPDGNGRIGDTENAKPAASMKDLPWGQIDLPNKVRMIVKLKLNAQGKMVADVEFRRGESAL